MAVTLSPHLAIQVCTLDAEDAGGIGNPAMVMLEDGGDVVALELGPGLFQRGVEARRADVAFELGVRQYVLESNQSARHEQDEPLEEAAQLRRIAAPRQRGHQRQGGPCERLDGLAVRATQLFEEVRRQDRYVFAPLPERGNLDADEREPLVQIRAEAAFVECRIDVESTDAIGRISSATASRPWSMNASRSRSTRTRRACARREIDDVLEEQNAAGCFHQAAVLPGARGCAVRGAASGPS